MIPPSCPIILMELRLFPDIGQIIFCGHKNTTCLYCFVRTKTQLAILKKSMCEAFTPMAFCLLMMRPSSPLKTCAS